MCWCSPIELAKEGRSKRRRRSPGFTYTSSVYWYEGFLGCWNSKREPRGACKWKLNGQQPLAKEKAGAVQACFLSASFLSWAFLGASKFPAALATSPHHHHSTKGRLHTCSMITFQVVEYLAMQNIKVAKNHYKKSHLTTFFVPKINFIQKWKLKILNTVEYKWPKNANGTFLWDFQTLWWCIIATCLIGRLGRVNVFV